MPASASSSEVPPEYPSQSSSDQAANPPPAGGTAGLPRWQLALLMLLLGAPVVGLLWVSSYARDEPRLFGFPFFYWYQFAWVFLAAATTSLAFQIVIRHERRRRAGARTTGQEVRR